MRHGVGRRGGVCDDGVKRTEKDESEARVVGVGEKARDTYYAPKNRISSSRRLIFMGSGGSGAMCGVFGGDRKDTGGSMRDGVDMACKTVSGVKSGMAERPRCERYEAVTKSRARTGQKRTPRLRAPAGTPGETGAGRPDGRKPEACEGAGPGSGGVTGNPVAKSERKSHGVTCE